jgi:hypothetical protein
MPGHKPADRSAASDCTLKATLKYYGVMQRFLNNPINEMRHSAATAFTA